MAHILSKKKKKISWRILAWHEFQYAPFYNSVMLVLSNKMYYMYPSIIPWIFKSTWFIFPSRATSIPYIVQILGKVADVTQRVRENLLPLTITRTCSTLRKDDALVIRLAPSARVSRAIPYSSSKRVYHRWILPQIDQGTDVILYSLTSWISSTHLSSRTTSREICNDRTSYETLSSSHLLPLFEYDGNPIVNQFSSTWANLEDDRTNHRFVAKDTYSSPLLDSTFCSWYITSSIRLS